jgi:predicted peptidase
MHDGSSDTFACWAKRFVRREHKDPDTGETLPYRLLVPNKPEGNRGHDPVPPKLPLVLFLHGAGERGTDNEAQLKNGAAELLGTDEKQAAFRCVYVLPQCPLGARWVEVDWAAQTHAFLEEPSRPLRLVLQLLADMVRWPSVDPARVYVVGLSMGGFGVFDLLSRCPDGFAAGVSVCGGADEAQAPHIAHIPVWLFHGADDLVVSVERSRRMFRALQTRAAPAVSASRYTEYPHQGHDVWTAAFSNPVLLPWLFAQHTLPTSRRIR